MHRDIAARNCLVSSIDEKQNAIGKNADFDVDVIVKIGDFGLARELYVTDYCYKSKQAGERL